jgi:hypothetical protein
LTQFDSPSACRQRQACVRTTSGGRTTKRPRTIATLAQKKGTVKDVQGLLRHSRAGTTTDVYMQKIPERMQATVDAINAELRKPEEIQVD